MKIFLALLIAVTINAAEMVSRVDSVVSSGKSNGGKSYTISISTEPCILDAKERKWIGLDSENREGSKVTKLQITIAGKVIAIPDNVFVDLADLHLFQTPSLMEDGDVYILDISGSDGAGSYTGRIYMNTVKITRRTMSEYYGQFENKVITIDEKF